MKRIIGIILSLSMCFSYTISSVATTENLKNKLNGKGTVVAVLDQAMDLKHKDFTLTNEDNVNIKKKDIDKLTEGIYNTSKIPYYNPCLGEYEEFNTHGTHVAGIVGANGLELKGIAPECQILNFNVINRDSKVDTQDWENTLKKYIKSAVDLKANVINMSLETKFHDTNPEKTYNKVGKFAEEQGTIIVAGAGNSAFLEENNPKNLDDTPMSFIGKAKEIFTVAACFNNEIKVNDMKINDKTFTYTGRISKEDKRKYKAIYLGDDRHKLYDVDMDLKDKVVILSNHEKLGAPVRFLISSDVKGIIVIDEDRISDIRETLYYVTYDNIGDFAIGINEGNLGNLKVGEEVDIDLSLNKERDIKVCDKMAEFSTWGPTNNLEFKPNITAPGVNIYSTLNNNKRGYMSGTSMAAPYVSGTMALMMENLNEDNKKFDTSLEQVMFIKNNAMNTADVLIDNKNNLPFATRYQGAGKINLDKMIKNNTILTGMDNRAYIELKDFEELQKDFTIKIKNNSNEDKIFYVKDKYGVLTNSSNIDEKYHTKKLDNAKVKFHTKEIIIKPKSEYILKCSLELEKNISKERFVEGFISLISKNEEKYPSLSIPYMGFYGKWDSISNIENIYVNKSSKHSKKETLTKVSDKIKARPNKGHNNIQVGIECTRELEYIKVNLLDKNHRKIAILRNEKYPLKMANKFWNKDNLFKEDNKYNLTIKDPITGVEKDLEDGEYIVEIVTKLTYDKGQEQIKRVPLLIKGKGGPIKIKSPLSVDKLDYNLEFSIDNRVDLKEIEILVNGKEYHMPMNIRKETKDYEFKSVLKRGDNIVRIQAIDVLGNISTVIKIIKIK